MFRFNEAIVPVYVINLFLQNGKLLIENDERDAISDGI